MNIPINPCPPVEVRIGLWEEEIREERTDDRLDGLIEEESEENFMDMVRQGLEM